VKGDIRGGVFVDVLGGAEFRTRQQVTQRCDVLVGSVDRRQAAPPCFSSAAHISIISMICSWSCARLKTPRRGMVRRKTFLLSSDIASRIGVRLTPRGLAQLALVEPNFLAMA